MNDGHSSRALAGSLSIWYRRMMKLITPGPDDRQHITDYLHEAESKHIIDMGTVAMMEGALLVSEMKVADIMVARSQMVFVEEIYRSKFVWTSLRHELFLAKRWAVS